MSKNKMNQKGGQIGGIGIDQLFQLRPIIILLLNVLFLGINYGIFRILFNNKEYNIIFYLFITLIIVSFFTIIFILWGILKINDSLVKYFVGSEKKESDPTIFARIVALIILTCSGLLQFISTTLFVTVLNNRKPINNNFQLTNTNAENLYNYEVLYIVTYIFSICVAVILITPLSQKYTTNEMLFYYATLFFAVLGLGYSSGSAFSSCFEIYSNVILKKNQLIQGSPDKTIRPPPTITPTITTVPILKTNVQPVQKIPLCTKPAVTDAAADPNDQCYS